MDNSPGEFHSLTALVSYWLSIPILLSTCLAERDFGQDT